MASKKSRRSRSRPRTSRAVNDDKVVVHGEGVRVDRLRKDLPIAEVHARFGGVDPLAILAGLAAALGTLLVLSSLLAAAGIGGYGQVSEQALSIAAVVAGVVALALALLFGGYVAGRVSRYEGARNGLLTGVLFALVTAGLSALAASTDEASRLDLPSWLDRNTASTAAIVTSVVALVVVLAASAIGGLLGSRWHRRPDEVLAGTRAGALTPYVADGDQGTGTAAPRGSAKTGSGAHAARSGKARR